MKTNEYKLKYFLNYSPSEKDLFVKANAVLWFKNKFLEYWSAVDAEKKSNYTLIIKELYMTENDTPLTRTAEKLNMHVRTLNRHREKFLEKMCELIEQLPDDL